ncbi:hypothetical protein [Marinobacter sp. SS21]|uniref:hypothetical protein n=1 Tax=Marinobacter sp. SS21 TaxID=2979460 RepID=UPI0023306DA5|nr:hypothetical protein [Marinobacter sp. SS21]MDC0662282.1 hypothetical protein [Marinobacter sp. SS21]
MPKYHHFCRMPGVPGREAGFVITLELLLIVTILVLGSMVGIVAIRDALVKQYVNSQSQQAIVADAGGKVLGKAVDFDEHDAPRIVLIDRSLPRSYRTLIGVRDDRFTSREAVYYAGPNCSGVPCLKGISDESSDSVGVDGLVGTGNVSYFNALQRGPNYAVGRSGDGLSGALYRDSGAACPVAIGDIRSRWISQKVVAGPPCEPIDLMEETRASAFTGCLVSLLEPCECPPGYQNQDDVLSNYLPLVDTLLGTTLATVNLLLLPTGQQLAPVEVGSLCCPEAMALQNDNVVNAIVYVVLDRLLGQLDLSLFPGVQAALHELLAPLQGDLSCAASIELRSAVSVPDPVLPSQNVLDQFTAPFSLSQPAGQSGVWMSVPPTPGEGW